MVRIHVAHKYVETNETNWKAINATSPGSSIHPHIITKRIHYLMYHILPTEKFRNTARNLIAIVDSFASAVTAVASVK